MTLARTRRVATLFGDGRIRPVESEVPALGDGYVMVKTEASLVSPGTELGGWRALANRMNSPVDAAPKPFGYSAAGRVIAVEGSEAEEFSVGDRVACIGGGFALHSDLIVVPHNLCVPLPENVSASQGAYAMLAATALHELRRAELRFGEFFAVVGLGVLGQLCAQFHQLAGQYVIGWDKIDFRVETSMRLGINAGVVVDRDDEVIKTREFTAGAGLDGATIAFGGDANSAIKALAATLKKYPDGHPAGVVTVVGGATFDYASIEANGLTNTDIRRSARTGFGYHDPVWEIGPAYPPVVMRWTTRTNLELCMRLIAENRLDVDGLTTHVIPFGRIESDLAATLVDPDKMLGVVFSYE